MDISDVCTAILRGDFDNGIEALYDALRNRQKISRQIKALTIKATLSPGQKVRLSRIKPSYLNGQEATVVSITRGGSRVDVKLISPIGKYGNTSPLGCPASCLEPI